MHVFVLPNERGVGPAWHRGDRKTRRRRRQRNRAKRLIREVFRRNKIAPGSTSSSCPKRELLDASLTTLEADYRNLVERRLRQGR